MIIIEGPDGSGKTRLAHTLSERMNLPIAPRVVAQDTTPLVDLKAWVDDNLDRGFQGAIFDRHRLISEPIYGTVLPWKNTDTEGFWGDLEWLAEAMGKFYNLRPLIIICLPPYEVVHHNLQDDPHNQRVLPHAWAIYRAYQAFAASGLCSRGVDLVYDYTSQHDRESYLRAIESRIMSAMYHHCRVNQRTLHAAGE